MAQFNPKKQIKTLEQVANTFAADAKTEIKRGWNDLASSINGKAHIISVVTTDGNDRAHIRFEIGGQRAWIAEYGRGAPAGTSAQHKTIKTSNTFSDLGSKNPYAESYRKSDIFNPVRNHFSKGGKNNWSVFRRLNDRPYKDLDGNVIQHGSLSPKVLEQGYKPAPTGKKGRPKSPESIAKLNKSSFDFEGKHIVANQVLVSIGTAMRQENKSVAAEMYENLASCAINRICEAIEEAGGKRS